MATIEEQQALLDFARRHNLWLLADEVYERLYYRGPVAPSILRLCTRDDAVIVIQSFSKAYRMTGWRLGWAVARRDLAHKAGQLNEFVISNAPSMIQRAGEAALALGEDDLAAMVELFGERMNFCYEALASMPGVSVPRPEGAFYLFPRIEGVENSYDFAVDLLNTEKVAVAPDRPLATAARDRCASAVHRIFRCWSRLWSGWRGIWGGDDKILGVVATVVSPNPVSREIALSLPFSSATIRLDAAPEQWAFRLSTTV